MGRKTLATLAMAGLLMGVGATTAGATESDPDASCWGLLTKAFAATETGILGEHSSAQETPRMGLRNLARALVEAGEIEDDSMATLGAYLNDALGLSIDACI